MKVCTLLSPRFSSYLPLWQTMTCVHRHTHTWYWIKDNKRDTSIRWTLVLLFLRNNCLARSITSYFLPPLRMARIFLRQTVTVETSLLPGNTVFSGNKRSCPTRQTPVLTMLSFVSSLTVNVVRQQNVVHVADKTSKLHRKVRRNGEFCRTNPRWN